MEVLQRLQSAWARIMGGTVAEDQTIEQLAEAMEGATPITEMRDEITASVTESILAAQDGNEVDENFTELAAQVNSMNETIGTMQTSITELQDGIDARGEVLTGLQTSIDGITEMLADDGALVTRIASIEQQVADRIVGSTAKGARQPKTGAALTQAESMIRGRVIKPTLEKVNSSK